MNGLYMVQTLHLWSRFSQAGYWWMHAMVMVWTLFALLLFVLEPLVVHRHFAQWAERDPKGAFTRLYRAHVVLLTLSVITVLAASAGAHGWFI